jgi:hypothetical protein
MGEGGKRAGVRLGKAEWAVISVASVLALAVAYFVWALCAGTLPVSDSSEPAAAATSSSPASAGQPVSAQDVQACKSAAMGLLAQDELQWEQGNDFGLSSSDVARQYGADSKVYRAWWNARGMLKTAMRAGNSNPMFAAQGLVNSSCG